MPQPSTPNHYDADLCIHIFTASSAMVGVCLTVVGLLRVVITLHKADTMADDLLLLDAVMFLIACGFSYWALRTRGNQRMHRIERVADITFMLALLMMVVITGFITYTFTFTFA